MRCTSICILTFIPRVITIEDQNLQETVRNPRRLNAANETEPDETLYEVYPSTFSPPKLPLRSAQLYFQTKNSAQGRVSVTGGHVTQCANSTLPWVLVLHDSHASNLITACHSLLPSSLSWVPLHAKPRWQMIHPVHMYLLLAYKCSVKHITF